MILFDTPPNWEKFKAKFLEFHSGIANDELKLTDGQFEVVNASFNDPGRNSSVFVECYQKLLKWPSKFCWVVLGFSKLIFHPFCR